MATIPIRGDIAGMAVEAARRGYLVFPVERDGKRPAISDWPHRACADPAHVEQAFRGRWAGFNYGIACGPPSGLVVVDIDVREGLDGRAEFVALCRDRGLDRPPQTLMIRTPSSGVHLYFGDPPSCEIRNSAGRIGRGIDVRGRGGYVVGAGSVVGGRPYAVMANLPVLPLPDWLAELADPAVATELPGTSRWPFCARMGHPGIADLVLFVASRPEGQRNNSLYWAARRAIECGHEDGLGALVFAAAKAGLPEDEAWRTVRSAQRQVAT